MTDQPLTIDDIAALLALCAARDQRTIGRTDILAWWQDLNKACIGKADAEAAISRYYAVEWPKTPADKRFRITAPIIIELVGKARAQRLEGFVFDSRDHREDTGTEYVKALRGQLAATGDGLRPAAPAGEIGGDPDAAKRVQELVEGVGERRTLPPEIAAIISKRRPPGLAIRCPAPNCRAAAGEHCSLGKGWSIAGGMHPSRVSTWAMAAANCPNCRAAAGDPCRHPLTHEPMSAATFVHPERIAHAKETA